MYPDSAASGSTISRAPFDAASSAAAHAPAMLRSNSKSSGLNSTAATLNGPSNPRCLCIRPPDFLAILHTVNGTVR